MTTTLQLGEEFRLPAHFKLAQGQAFCGLRMFAAFDDLEARQLHITPLISDANGRREGQIVEVKLDENGNGKAAIALPVLGDASLKFALAVAYRVDQNDLMTLTLTGDKLKPKEQVFLVNARRPTIVAASAKPSLAERARLPEGAILDEGYPFGTEEGYIADGQVYANLGQFGDHPEHAPTGHETGGADNHGLGAC